MLSTCCDERCLSLLLFDLSSGSGLEKKRKEKLFLILDSTHIPNGMA